MIRNKKTKARISKDKKSPGLFRREFYLIGTAILIVIILTSFHTQSAGIIGSFLTTVLLTLFGIGGYVFPYFLMLGLLLYFMRKERFEKNVLALSIMYVAVLGMLDIAVFENANAYMGFVEKIESAAKIGKSGFGGGVVGAFVTYSGNTLLGTTATFLIYLVMIALSVVMISNKKLSTILKDLVKYMKLGKELLKKSFIKYKKMKQEKSVLDKTAVKENKKTSKENVSEKALNSETRDLKILDHNNSENSLKKERRVKAEDIKQDKIFDEIIEKEISESRVPYKFPPIEFLREKEDSKNDEKSVVRDNAKKLLDTLSNFGIEAQIDQVSIGPSITKYEIQIAAGIKVSRILSLTNDLALSLASFDIRIEAPIPGKSAIGIEVPNKYKTGVNLREILSSKEFENCETTTPIALGKSVEGESIVADIGKMPHMLIAGATGSGKSVCINTIITSILYKSTPEDVKLILIDPKVVELSVYNGIPHLLIPVVTDPKKAAGALNWAVQEMNKRYESFAANNVRDISGYNRKLKENEQKMPKIVMIIDELSDLMMVSSSEVEDLICRIAQMARAAGIHLILATQRPSVDVITGTIKANIPSRISFAVSSQVDSRTILDMGGAEKLLGRGDMLYSPVGSSKPIRIQGAFIDDEEVERIVNYVKNDSEVEYEKNLIEELEREVDLSGECDELLSKAIDLALNDGQASISLLQRRLKIGYARAARIIDQMEERGIIGGYEGSKPRKVLVEREEIK